MLARQEFRRVLNILRRTNLRSHFASTTLGVITGAVSLHKFNNYKLTSTEIAAEVNDDESQQEFVSQFLSNWPLVNKCSFSLYKNLKNIGIPELDPALAERHGSEKHSLLSFAVYQGWEIMALKLINEGYDIRHKVRNNINLLQLAILSKNILMVKQILALGCDKLLLEKNIYGEHALHIAAKSANFEILELLLSYKDFRKHINDFGHNNELPLAAACYEIENDDLLLRVLKLLLSHGAILNNDIDTSGFFTGQHFCLRFNNMKSLKFLLDNGAVLGSYDIKKLVEKGMVEYLYLLEKNGQKIDDKLIKTAQAVELIKRSRCDSEALLENVEELLNKGAILNFQMNSTASSILHQACLKGFHNLVLSLVNKRAIPANEELDIICGMGWEDVLKAIHEKRPHIITNGLYYYRHRVQEHELFFDLLLARADEDTVNELCFVDNKADVDLPVHDGLYKERCVL